MTPRFRVTCVKHGPPGANAADAILALGGPEGPTDPSDHRQLAATGTAWSKTAAAVIDDIRGETCGYYVSIGLRAVALVLEQQGSRTVLTTAFGPETSSILLDLPECP